MCSCRSEGEYSPGVVQPGRGGSPGCPLASHGEAAFLRIWKSSQPKLPLHVCPWDQPSVPVGPTKSPAWALSNPPRPATPCLTSGPSLVHPDSCYSRLDLTRLPKGSLQASPQLLDQPTGEPGQQTWSPAEAGDLLRHMQAPYLQLDLLRPRNLTGQWGGGGGLRRR